MAITPKHLSLPTVFTLISLILCIGCESETDVHVLSSPTDEPVTTEAPAEPAEEEMPAAEMPTAEMPAEMPAEAAPEPELVEEPEPIVEEAPAEEVFPDDIAVTVNGMEITEAELQEMIQPRLDRMLAQGRGRKMTDNFIEDTKKRLRGQALEAAVIEKLVEQDLQNHNIVITEEQINQHIQEMADQQNMTVDDLKALVEASGKTFEQWKEQMQFDKRLAVLELIKIRGLGDLDITEDEALEYYNDNPQRYEMPEQVRVSHILIKPDTSDPNIDSAKANTLAIEKARVLLEKIKAGADFAELARENSACPSGKNGGDLGFGQRRTWVKPFSDAAFGLEVGEVSPIVQSRYGYHIIKCTGQKEAGTQSFDEVKNDIINRLRAQRHQELMQKYFELIKSEATIVYPEGKEPED